jgi:hypothetical protein
MASLTRHRSQSLVEHSIRYVLSNPNFTTTLVGLSTLEQLDHAAQSAKKGPLPAEALKLISTIQQGFVGEPRSATMQFYGAHNRFMMAKRYRGGAIVQFCRHDLVHGS